MTKHQEVQDSTCFKSSSSLRIPSGFGLLCDLKISIFSSIFRKWLVYLWDPTWFWILPLFVFFLQLANMILPEDENFLLCFRREAPLKSSVDFMKVSSESVAVARHLLASGWASSRYRETNKENLSGTYLSVKHPESDKTDDYTVGWISGYLGYRISEVMLRWSHRGRAPEETCVWLAWTAKLCFLVTICL